jgi:very-short-patch-repair endonuclease
MEHVHARAAADARIAALAAAQHGVVDLDALRAAGLGLGAVNHRVRAGRLHRLHRGVFAVGHTRLSREGWCMAALLATGNRAVLSHVRAAVLCELRPSSAASIHVTVPTYAGRLRRTGIVVHRSRSLGGADVGERDGIAVTSVARTCWTWPACSRRDRAARGQRARRGEEVDFLWRSRTLIVQTDGHAHHGTRRAFERDRTKDARLTMLGHRVVRFTYRLLVYEREVVVATLLLRLLATRPPPVKLSG